MCAFLGTKMGIFRKCLELSKMVRNAKIIVLTQSLIVSHNDQILVSDSIPVSHSIQYEILLACLVLTHYSYKMKQMQCNLYIRKQVITFLRTSLTKMLHLYIAIQIQIYLLRQQSRALIVGFIDNEKEKKFQQFFLNQKSREVGATVQVQLSARILILRIRC